MDVGTGWQARYRRESRGEPDGERARGTRTTRGVRPTHRRAAGGSAPDRATPSAADTVGELGEFGLIDRLTDGRFQPEHTLLGPGDDAAVVAAPDGRVVATVDTLVEGVHFRLDWSAPEQVGKAVAANLSDVAAMGAVPTALLLSLACPGTTSTRCSTASPRGVGRRGGRGHRRRRRRHRVPDTIVVSITALGTWRAGRR